MSDKVTLEAVALAAAYEEYKRRRAEPLRPDDYPLVYAIIAYLKAAFPTPTERET